MLRYLLPAVFTGLLVSGCTTLRETNPTQTAREQLLMSTAADQASAQIQPNLPLGTKIFVDAGDSGAGDNPEYNKRYAVGAIKSALLARGYDIVMDANQADTVANVRIGALSINKKTELVGIPSATIPIPLSGPIDTPQLAIWSSAKRTGIAKFGLAFYDAKTGVVEDLMGPVYGISYFNQNSVFGFGWTRSNLLPDALKDKNR